MLTSRVSIRVFVLTALAALVGARVPTLQLLANGVASQAEGPATIDQAVLARDLAAFNVEARRLGLEAIFARTHSAEGSHGRLPES